MDLPYVYLHEGAKDITGGGGSGNQGGADNLCKRKKDSSAMAWVLRRGGEGVVSQLVTQTAFWASPHGPALDPTVRGYHGGGGVSISKLLG